ncbi:MAG: hypothetical protein CUN55_11770 [Phototrophicales bacterium]|nr:MAG: hypothetical protein CUN55_11770 [Phototrophicales bacterium]
MTSQRYELPLFPLTTVLFPGMMLPLHIFEERYKEMIQRCLNNDEDFGVILLKAGRAEGPLGDIYDVGTVAHITQIKPLEGGRMNIISLGHKRFRLISMHHANPYLTGIVEDFPLTNVDLDRTYRLSKRVIDKLTTYLRAFKEVGRLNINLQQFPTDPETLAYLTAILLPVENKEKQELLATEEADQMLATELKILKHEVSIMSILIDERPVQQSEISPFSLN